MQRQEGRRESDLAGRGARLERGVNKGNTVKEADG